MSILKKFSLKIYRFIYIDQRGASAVEYALLIGLIALVVIVAVTALGKQIKAIFDNVSNALPK